MTSSLSTSVSTPPAERAGTARGTIRWLAASLALMALTLSPLLWAAVPPLVDYPNHLARMWVLVQNGALPDLASNYAVRWHLLPNLAMDLIVPALAQFMPLETAGRLFIALTMLSLVAGTVTLHSALHGRLGFWPLSSLLFLYNAALFWGFLNCLFGIGMFLLAFSGWIATRHWKAGWRIPVFAAIASVLLILHLFAFCLYGLAVGSYEFGNRLRERNLPARSVLSLCVIGLQFIPGVLLWLASLSNVGTSYTEYRGLAEKLFALQAPFTFGPDAIPFDGVFLIFSLGFMVAAIAARALKLAPEMRLPLIAMILVAAAMPTWASGSWLADIRLPVALPFLIIASTRLEPVRLRAVSLFAALAVILLGIRVWAVSESWRDYDQRFADFRAAARVITPGARLLIVEDMPFPDTARALKGVPSFLAVRWEQIFVHMPALAVIDRSAFIPYLFTGWTPVAPTARNAGLFQTQSNPLLPDMLRQSAVVAPGDPANGIRNILGEPTYWSNWPQHFDFVLWIDFEPGPASSLATLQPLAQGSFFRIYRVARPAD